MGNVSDGTFSFYLLHFRGKMCILSNSVSILLIAAKESIRYLKGVLRDAYIDRSIASKKANIGHRSLADR